MHECIKPRQYVVEHERDYIYSKGGRYYVWSYYAGECEIAKDYYEKLKKKGYRERV